MKHCFSTIIFSMILSCIASLSYAEQPIFYSTECYDYSGAVVTSQPNFNIDSPTYVFQDEYGRNYIEYNLNILSLFTTPARTFLFYQSCGKLAVGDRFVSNIEASCWAIRHMISEGMIPFNYIYYIDEELKQREKLYRLNLGIFELTDCFN